MKSDYQNYSLADLYQAIGSVDKGAYPERYALLMQEIQARKSSYRKSRKYQLTRTTKQVPLSNAEFKKYYYTANFIAFGFSVYLFVTTFAFIARWGMNDIVYILPVIIFFSASIWWERNLAKRKLMYLKLEGYEGAKSVFSKIIKETHVYNWSLISESSDLIILDTPKTFWNWKGERVFVHVNKGDVLINSIVSPNSFKLGSVSFGANKKNINRVAKILTKSIKFDAD